MHSMASLATTRHPRFLIAECVRSIGTLIENLETNRTIKVLVREWDVVKPIIFGLWFFFSVS